MVAKLKVDLLQLSLPPQARAETCSRVFYFCFLSGSTALALYSQPPCSPSSEKESCLLLKATHVSWLCRPDRCHDG